MAPATQQDTQQSHSAGQPNPKQADSTPSDAKGDGPSTAGQGKHDVKSNTPENAEGRINPSSPEDANVTPGSTVTSAGEK